MQISIVIQYLFYFISITIHLTYAVVIGILTHKGLLVEFAGNIFLIFLGSLGTLLLSGLFIYTLQRHWRTGRFAVPDVQIGFIFLFMVCELFFVGIEFSGNKNIDCKADTSDQTSPCTFRPAIFGLVFTAGIILGMYFFAMLVGRFTCPGVLSTEGPEKVMESGQYVHELRPMPKNLNGARGQHAPTYPPMTNRSNGVKKDKRPPNLFISIDKPLDMDVPLSPTQSSVRHL